MIMLLLKICGILLMLFSTSQGFGVPLRCWKCLNAPSNKDCIINGAIETCQSNQEACQSTVRSFSDGRLLITKGCKQVLACYNNQLQNNRGQCKVGEDNSVCRCCCYDNQCNEGALWCRGGQAGQAKFILGRYTLEDLPGIEKTFKMMDVTKDGILSLEELVGFFTSVGLGGADVLKYSEGWIRHFDDNNDGSLELNEYKVQLTKDLNSHDLSTAVQPYQAFDMDRNGEITLDEYRMVTRSMGYDMTEAELVELLSGADRIYGNLDGKTTFIEYGLRSL